MPSLRAVPGMAIGGRMQRVWIVLGSLAGFGAVAMAAFAAHGIRDPAAQHMVNSGVQMQGWHALALLGTGLWATTRGQAGRCGRRGFRAGLLLFCGAVYSLGVAGVSWGILAPTGGTLLMLGWLLLGASALRAR